MAQEQAAKTGEKKPWFVHHSPEIGATFADFYEACNEKGSLDKKTKELLMIALACAFRCPHCTESHIKRALAMGVSKQEVSEALLFASVEAAGTQLYWCQEIYEKHLGE